jgi:hypothetical protein
MKKLRFIGMGIGIIAMILGWIWFGWKLSLVILLAIWGNNLEKE